MSSCDKGRFINIFSKYQFGIRYVDTMDFQNDRPMVDVDLSCAECGTHISQLPFQPSGDRPVYCRDCNRARRDNNSRGPRERKMYDVDVNCSGCGTRISQLPFQPRDTSNIQCRDCYLKNKDN